jgi:hypothetical protein
MAGEETASGSKPPAAATTIRLVNFISEDQVSPATARPLAESGIRNPRETR